MTFLDFIVSLHKVIHVRLKKEDGKGGKEGGREERTKGNKKRPIPIPPVICIHIS